MPACAGRNAKPRVPHWNAIMEIWKVDAITLLSRPPAGQSPEEVSVGCLTVAWTASNDHGADTDETRLQGYLLATGVDVPALRALPWRPGTIRFAVKGAMEPREFPVDDYVVEDPGQGIVRFDIP
jgi:hypothetical protein